MNSASFFKKIENGYVAWIEQGLSKRGGAEQAVAQIIGELNSGFAALAYFCFGFFFWKFGPREYFGILLGASILSVLALALIRKGYSLLGRMASLHIANLVILLGADLLDKKDLALQYFLACAIFPFLILTAAERTALVISALVPLAFAVFTLVAPSGMIWGHVYTLEKTQEMGFQAFCFFNNYFFLILAFGHLVASSHVLRRILKQQRAQLEVSGKLSSLGEMAAGMSHEINNPLTILSGSISRVKKANRDGGVERELTRMTAMIERIARIIQALRTFARDASKDPLEWNLIAELCTESLELCRSKIQLSEVTLQWAVSADSKLRVRCRPVQFTQVFVQLVANACDAMVDQNLSGPDRWLKIELIEFSAGGCRVLISNGGPPIPEEVRKKLFQPFFTTKDPDRGSGLGLSTSLGMMKSQGGDLTYVENAPSTTFAIVFDSPSAANQNQAKESA